MNTARNLVICGSAIFVLWISYSLLFIHNSSVKLGSAKEHAEVLGKKAAIEEFKSGKLVLLAASYGWGPRYIPGVSWASWEYCLSKFAKLEVYRENGDVYIPEEVGEELARLQSRPEETDAYALGFNQEIIRLLKKRYSVKCV